MAEEELSGWHEGAGEIHISSFLMVTFNCELINKRIVETHIDKIKT